MDLLQRTLALFIRQHTTLSTPPEHTVRVPAAALCINSPIKVEKVESVLLLLKWSLFWVLWHKFAARKKRSDAAA